MAISTDSKIWNDYVVRSILANNEFDISQINDVEEITSGYFMKSKYPEVVMLIKNGDVNGIRSLAENKLEEREYFRLNSFHMRVRLLFLLLVLQFAYNYSFCQVKDSAGVYVMGASFYMTTFVRITCEVFGSDHAPWIKYRHVIYQDTLAMLDSFLEKVKYKRKNYEIDVRAKMIYIKANKARIFICMNSNSIMINGRLIEQNEPFITFLRRLTPYK